MAKDIEEMLVPVETLKKIEHSNIRYRIAAQHSSEIILDCDLVKDSIHHVTKRIEEIYGIPQTVENAVEYLINLGTVQPESAEDFREAFRRLRQGEPQIDCVLRTRTIDGKTRWSQLILTSIFDEENHPVRAIGVLKDITLQRVAEQQYESQMMYRDAIEKDALLSYEADLTHRKIVSGMGGVFKMLGKPPTSDYEEAVDILISNLAHEEDRIRLREIYDADYLITQCQRGKNKIEMDYRRIITKDKYCWVRGTCYLLEDKQANTIRAYYYVNDIDKAKQRELHLQRQAERDLLTGLYNKGTAEARIRKAIAEGEAPGRTGAFLIVDLDDFKNINDQMGHAFGDAVLSQTAQKLQGMCRGDDIAGRIGGDEFVVYLKNLPDGGMAEKKAKGICEALRNAYSYTQDGCKISATVGISLFPSDGKTFEALYEKADNALYHAKAQGKDGYCMFHRELKAGGKGRLLRAAIDNNAEKTFAENIIEYVFRILYESRDLNRAIGGVLELVSKYFNFSKGYVYECEEGGSVCTKSFEWCGKGVEPFPLQFNVLQGEMLKSQRQRFGPEGIYLMRYCEGEDQETGVAEWDRGVKFRLQYALMGDGKFQGFVGFDSRDNCELLSADQQETLRSVAQMLDVFLTEKHTTDKLKESGLILQAVADSLRSCTYIIDPETYVLQFVNQNTRRIITDALPGTLCYETIRGRSKPCEDCPITKMVSDNIREYQTEMYLDHYQLWAKINATIIQLADGRDYGLFNGYDFAEYKKQNGRFMVGPDAFTQDVSLFKSLSYSTDDYIFMCDMPKNLFYFPKAMVEEFNLPGQVIEDAIPIWASRIHEQDREGFLKDLEEMISGKTNLHNQEYRAKNKKGNWIWLRCRGYLERDRDGNPAIFAGVIVNLGKKSKIDHLSGLPDKHEFEVKVQDLLADGPQSGGMLIMGLDNFKYINNLYGWEFGDQVIRETAQKLQDMLPDKVQLYRLDGDWFGAYFSEDYVDQIETFYRAAFTVLQRKQKFGEHQYYCTVSGGYSIFEDGSGSFMTLLKQAEYALEYSKNEGKNCLSRYNDELMSGRERSIILVARLQESVDHGFEGFELFFQPQVEPKTHMVKGAEALLRWRCADFGSIPPDEFVPLLEQTGLIHAVGRWVLLHASETCKAWRVLRPDFTVNINLSYAQLQDKNFLPYLTQLVKSGQLDAEAIHLEMTESCIASGSSSLTEAFKKLRDLGFCIEMDDFGTGYSSLEILKNAPADVVKIDHAFVMDITRSEFDATFIQFVVSLCHSVGIRVCLEGVETWAEYYMVEPMSLDLIQGYLFGRPQSRLDFEKNYLNEARMS